MRKLILRPTSPGDAFGDQVMMTIAVRDLHMAYPGEYLTDVRGQPGVWMNNPYITPIDDNDTEAEKFTIGYPLLQNPQGRHFSDAHRLHLAEQLGIEIPWTNANPDLHLTDEEKDENLVERECGYPGKYWVLNAGYKSDANNDGMSKFYPFWQEVVDLVKNHIQIVQIGTTSGAQNDELDSVFSLIDKTTDRQAIQVIHRSEGTIGPLSFQFLVAAAFNKPSVVLASGKEPPSWQQYDYHRYLHVCGCLPCAPGNGCWTLNFKDCRSRAGNVPRCYAMIPPAEVARNVMLYYDGGVLRHG